MAFIKIEHPDITAEPAEVHHTALPAYQERGWKRHGDDIRYQPDEGHEDADAFLSGLAEAATPPAESASKAAWVEHAIAQGVDPAEADASTKPDLIKRLGAEGSN